MNDKQNDKPIEMPSRGRPRKKDHNSDPVFNNEFMKGMFTPKYETKPEETGLGGMCPYNIRDESKLLEQFNRIGDVMRPASNYSYNYNNNYNYNNGNIDSPFRNPPLDDPSQISPREVQNGKPPFNHQMNNFNHQMNNQRSPFYEDPSFTNFFPKQDFQKQDFQKQDPNFFSKHDPSDLRSSPYPYFTNSRPVLNTFYKPPYMRHQNYYRAPIEEPLDPWAYKKKRKNNPILWQYVKNSGDNFQSVVHPSKYSSLDYIQGSDLFRRNSQERDCNNSILPLFLNSNKEINDEYRQIIKNFQKRVKELDFTNVTVHQLKLLMREFGLNHTGKKNELIDRAKQTLKKIELACSGAHKRAEENKNEEKNDDEYESVFF